MIEIYKNKVGLNVLVKLRNSGKTFTGKLISIDSLFLKIDDDFCGIKLITLSIIDSIEVLEK